MINQIENPIPLRQAVLEARERIKTREKRKGLDRKWDTFGSRIEDYWSEFEIVLQNRDVLADLKAASDPVVIDLLSSTVAVSTLFRDLPQEHKLGIAVGRSDKRSRRQQAKEARLGIHQIAGDITHPKTWQEIEKILAGRKANLIIERGLGAVSLYMPRHRDFYGIVAQKAWDLLSRDNGSVLAHLPEPSILAEDGADMPKWRRLLDLTGIDYSYDLSTSFTPILRLLKTHDSPERLPLVA
jgi:hypothetical protein